MSDSDESIFICQSGPSGKRKNYQLTVKGRLPVSHGAFWSGAARPLTDCAESHLDLNLRQLVARASCCISRHEVRDDMLPIARNSAQSWRTE